VARRALIVGLAIDGVAQRRPDELGGPATAHLFIINPLRGRSVLSWLSTHPPIEERVARLRAMAQRP
jgi:heat shock protein HtpX